MPRIGIIGGGPGGFATARTLALEPADFDITIFERRSVPGGVWEFTGKGPLYRDLDTNIYSRLMEFKDYPFKEEPQFVSRDEVREYVAKYSQDISQFPNVHVKYSSAVKSISKPDKTWIVQVESNGETTKTTTPYEFDFIVIAAGHYEFPYFPPIPGLDSFPEVLHTKDYFEPSKFANRRGLVVGNSSSGTDVSIQLLRVTAPLTISRLAAAPSDEAFDSDVVIWKPRISKIEGSKVYFEDGTSDNFDFIMFATGYLYKQPLIEQIHDKLKLPILQADFLRFKNLYKFIFYIGDPTLAFVSLNTQIIPMPFVESQGAIIARVWNGRLKLPTEEEMLECERQLVAKKGEGAGYFYMGYPDDAAYMDELHEWADSAGDGGFHAENWDDRKRYLRGNIIPHKLTEYRRKVIESNKIRNSSS